jgi:hypothetical protein
LGGLCDVLRGIEDSSWCRDTANFLEALQHYCNSNFIDPNELLTFMAEQEMQAAGVRFAV